MILILKPIHYSQQSKNKHTSIEFNSKGINMVGIYHVIKLFGRKYNFKYNYL